MLEGPRSIAVDELDEAAHLADLVFRPATGSMARECPLLFANENAGNLLAVFDGSHPVSFLGIRYFRIVAGGPVLTAGCVGAVCTHPDYRGRRLATRLLDHALEAMRGQGAHVTLISGGRGLYLRAGAVGTGRMCTFQLAADSAPGSAGIALTAAAARDAEVLDALYREEPVHYERTVDDFRAFLATRYAMDRPCDCLVVKKDGKPAAYLAVHTETRAHGPAGEPSPACSVKEYAGDRKAVIAGLQLFMGERGLRDSSITVLASDVQLASMLADRNSGCSSHNWPGTVAVLDLPAIITAVFGSSGPDAPTASQEGDRYSISLGAEQLELRSTGEVTKLIFGSAEEPAPALPAGPLGKLLASRLPLPLPLPGYNSV